jgi:hypothetical protein
MYILLVDRLQVDWFIDEDSQIPSRLLVEAIFFHSRLRTET